MTDRMLQTGHGAACRGGRLPGRARLAARRGVTLVELLVSMLILTIVCLAWLEIIGIQSARKEARRREAVERLAGMMDAFMALSPKGKIPLDGKERKVAAGNYYKLNWNGSSLSGGLNFSSGSATVAETFGADAAAAIEAQLGMNPGGQDLSPIRYQLHVVEKDGLPRQSRFSEEWGTEKKWLVGSLYDVKDTQNGVLTGEKPFFTLQVRLWY